MIKPKPINSKPYYDLISVLEYVDDKIPKFHKKIWRELCEIGYINNDTITGIGWDTFVHENADKDIINCIDYMFSEFPDIKTGMLILVLVGDESRLSSETNKRK